MALPIEEQNIIKILGIEALPDERKVALLQQITELVEKRLLLRVLEFLKSPQREEFEQLLDKGASDQLPSFLQKNVPEFEDWAVEEVGKVKRELGDLAGNAK